MSSAESALLVREGRKIVEALGKMFTPFCEVVLHDLTRPDHAIVAIEGDLSGRLIGDPVTELGLARMRDPNFPDIVQNYPNRLPDGRPVKSTSIGLKNSDGEYAAAICLNFDISMLERIQKGISQLIRVGEDPPVSENIRARSADDLRSVVIDISSRFNQTPRGLSRSERRYLVKELKERGFLGIKNSVPIVAECLGVSRTSIYNYVRHDGKLVGQPDPQSGSPVQISTATE